MNTQLDELVEALKKENNRENMDALWKHTFDLSRWYFIARGEAPKITPFIGIVNDAPMLMAFTDSKYAYAFAKNNDLLNAEGKMEVLEISPKSFASPAKNLMCNGVKGIVFNEGFHGYFAPLQNIEPMLSYFYKDE